MSISIAEIDAFPKSFNWTVMFLVTTVGGSKSCTVTVVVAEADLPWLSDTVRTTVLGPVLLQVKAEGFTVMLVAPVEPLSTSAGVMPI
jgi:hypothetical protein